MDRCCLHCIALHCVALTTAPFRLLFSRHVSDRPKSRTFRGVGLMLKAGPNLSGGAKGHVLVTNGRIGEISVAKRRIPRQRDNPCGVLCVSITCATVVAAVSTPIPVERAARGADGAMPTVEALVDAFVAAPLPPPATSLGPQSPLFFFHQRKTAGSSLRLALKAAANQSGLTTSLRATTWRVRPGTWTVRTRRLRFLRGTLRGPNCMRWRRALCWTTPTLGHGRAASPTCRA
jgi:hypothetical protein